MELPEEQGAILEGSALPVPGGVQAGLRGPATETSQRAPVPPVMAAQLLPPLRDGGSDSGSHAL